MNKKPTKLLVCFLGVDGSGKTTASQSLCETMKRKGLKHHYRRISSPLSRSPLLGSYKTLKAIFIKGFLRRPSCEKVARSAGFAFPPRIFILASLMMHLIESIAIYTARVRPALRDSVVVYDRYFYDYAVLYLDFCPRWLQWCYRNLIPIPDVVFLLDADHFVMQARDGEHHPHFYPEQRRKYLKFTSSLPNQILTILDANQDPAIINQTVQDMVFNQSLKKGECSE